MAKRYSATEIWGEDWFLEMPNEYKLFWFYMLSACDHAGFWKVNIRFFNSLLGVQVETKKALELFNKGKERIRIISDSVWYIEEFFVFQYGHHVSGDNNVHKSVVKLWKKHGVLQSTVKGLAKG